MFGVIYVVDFEELDPLSLFPFFHPCKRFEKFLILGCVCAGAHVTAYMWWSEQNLCSWFSAFTLYRFKRPKNTVVGLPGRAFTQQANSPAKIFLYFIHKYLKKNLGSTVRLISKGLCILIERY